MIYILALLISICLIAGQTLWGSSIKVISANGAELSSTELISKLLVSQRFWIGALFYLTGTLFYFLLLSKVKFFSVQITMTGLAIIFSVLISHFFFKEVLSIANIVGVMLVLSGIVLVMQK